MPFSNRLTRILDRLAFLPAAWRLRAFSFLFGRVVPLVGTAGVRIHEVSEERVVLTLKNRRKVRNHVGGVHAAAVALLAETASGLIVGRNLPDTALPLIKSMKLDFVKRNRGAFRAVATLTRADIERLRGEAKGDLLVPVTLTDAQQLESVRCEMLWAWVPAKR